MCNLNIDIKLNKYELVQAYVINVYAINMFTCGTK